MKITWIGHSCFRIEANGYSVVTDPYAPGSVPGLGSVREHADAVLCSHEHGDHNYREAVRLASSGAKAPAITEIHSFHDEVGGRKRGNNIIRILDFDGVKAAHMGDIGCELKKDEMELLEGLDVMLIPVGGTYTIDGKQAAKLVEKLQPKVVVPMHYRDDDAGFGFGNIGTVDSFVKNTSYQVSPIGSEFEVSEIPEHTALLMMPKALM